MDRRYAIAAGFLTILTLIIGRMILFQPGPPPIPPEREVLVANMGGHSIVGFPVDSTGRVNTTPWRVIRGPRTELRNPIDVALDDGGRIYVANLGDPPGNQPSVTVYDPNANGDTQPIRVIRQISTPRGLNVVRPTSIAIRRTPENILLTDQVAPSISNGRISEFPMMSGQDALTGGVEGIAVPTGIALDLRQRLHIAEPTQNAILIFTVQGHNFVNAPPGTTISGTATLLNNPVRLAVDLQGNIYVVNRGTPPYPSRDGSITVYAPGSSGDVAPARRIGGPFADNARLSDPYGISVDAAGQIYVTGGNSLKTFAVSANGNVSPQQVIGHEELNNTVGVAIRE